MKFNQAPEKNAYKGWDRYTAVIVVESFSKSFVSLALPQAQFISP
jgi:DNA-binding transcriptional MocR family regulator